ncbi:hypothetical protein RRG08_047253 [Elysia crispata]|uniref:Uncharacterized protein n=1 Tax=Elysia crispata TaxID=231223 RepID=A0AAE1A2P5_9GAST|nr:hypothetical protein RRG08_047253 [Elysia crispata]
MVIHILRQAIFTIVTGYLERCKTNGFTLTLDECHFRICCIARAIIGKRAVNRVEPKSKDVRSQCSRYTPARPYTN